MTDVDWSSRVGDVLVVRTGGLAARLIRLGAALADRPNLDNHVAVVSHVDAAGTPWVIEGRPGGVGWRDARAYAASPYLVTNDAQPKTAVQRREVAGVAVSLLGTPYDWSAIAADAAHDLDLPALWARGDASGPPAHVVCSSLAAWCYRYAGLAAPGSADWRRVQPADWCAFVATEGWRSR